MSRPLTCVQPRSCPTCHVSSICVQTNHGQRDHAGHVEDLKREGEDPLGSISEVLLYIRCLILHIFLSPSVQCSVGCTQTRGYLGAIVALFVLPGNDQQGGKLNGTQAALFDTPTATKIAAIRGKKYSSPPLATEKADTFSLPPDP